MYIAKALLNFAGIVLVVYLGVFFLWLMLATACLQYVDQHGWSDAECGQDLMSQVVRTTHAPLIHLIIGSQK